jgi:hypothetical protein
MKSKANKWDDTKNPHTSRWCSAPGGGEDIERLRSRVSHWIYKDLPLRPGNIKTAIPKEERQGRQRSKSPTRRRSQEREDEQYGPGFSAWDIGEAEEIQKDKLKKLLRSARRELIEKRQLTEELKNALAAQVEEAPESDTKEKAIDFLVNLRTIKRINQLKWLMTEGHQAKVERQFQLGVIRGEDYKSDKNGEQTPQKKLRIPQELQAQKIT